MKKAFISLLFLSTLGSTIHCQTRMQLMQQINEFKRTVADNPSFNKPEADVWNGMYSAASGIYKINKESESRGFMEGVKEDELSKETISLQILGKEQPFQVSVSIQREERTKNYQTGAYTEWRPGSSYAVKSSTEAVKMKIYENINGKIEINPELQKTVDEYNAKQEKDRKKIVKGVHY